MGELSTQNPRQGRPGPLALALSCLAAGLLGCEHPTAIRESGTPPPALPALAPSRVITPEFIVTYDGSGQVVHPDVVVTPPGVFAHPWHLALTPFPGGAPTYENPSIYASDDGETWVVEPGASNPVALPRRSVAGELLSDPALVYVPESRELWLYYRSYTADSDYVWLLRSPDAVHWSAPALVLAAGIGQVLSPSVVRRSAGEWLMWSVSGRCDAGNAHLDLRRSADGLAWSAPQALVLPGLSPWHVFVRWVASLSTWMLATNVKSQAGSCLTKELYLAFSDDGVLWTPRDTAWLDTGSDPSALFSGSVYRAAFAETGDSLRFWYSGAVMTDTMYACQQRMCMGSALRWSRLGTEIRAATDVLARPHR